MHHEKMAATDISFRRCAIIEFLVRKGNSEEVITKHGMALHHIAQKEAERVTSAGKFMGTVFWDSEGCILVDFLEKGGKRPVQFATFRRSTNFVMRFVKNVRRRKLSSFNMTTRGLTLHV